MTAYSPICCYLIGQICIKAAQEKQQATEMGLMKHYIYICVCVLTKNVIGSEIKNGTSLIKHSSMGINFEHTRS